jgi:hypothetical protein
VGCTTFGLKSGHDDGEPNEILNSDIVCCAMPIRDSSLSFEELVVATVVVVGQPKERDGHADDQGRQQGNEGDHPACIEVFEEHPLGLTRNQPGRQTD